MSSSQVSRVRRNGSPPPQQPGRKHQPLRATVPFQLLGATATRGPAPASSPAPAAAAAQGCPHNNGGAAAAVAVAAAAASAASTAVATTPATVASAVVAVVVAASSHVPVPGFGSGYGGAAQAGDAGSTATAATATKQAASPERRSPASPGCKAAAAGGAAGERQRVARASSSSPSVGGPARRAAAGGGGGCPAPLDAIAGAYLTGQWPRDHHHHHHPHPAAPAVRDKATQTPRAWADESWDPHRRAPLWESSEQRKEIAKLRQQLQRSKQSGLEREAVSPLLAGLAGLTGLTGLTAPPPPPTVGAQPLVAMPKPVAVALAGFPSMPGGSGGGAATAPTLGKGVLPRLRASVEALNQEIERVFVQEAWCHDSPRQDAPDGRRAPLPTRPCSSNSGIGGGSSGSSGSGGGSNTATRSVDTQTPSALDGERCRSLPASPALLPPLPPPQLLLPLFTITTTTTSSSSSITATTSPSVPLPLLRLRSSTVPRRCLRRSRSSSSSSSSCSSCWRTFGSVEVGAPLCYKHDNPRFEPRSRPTPSAPHQKEGAVGAGDPEGRGGSPLPKYVSSPKPNHSYTFMREPPEGCERVTAFEETQQHKEIPSIFCPDKNKVNFVIKSDTAFCPISLLRPPPRILHFTPEPAAQGSAQDAGQGSAGDAPEEMESPSCMLRQRSADR
ncbi:LOW QUALITY PROTEIN: uncharacterized protein LOC144736730 [Lampetra planeri]